MNAPYLEALVPADRGEFELIERINRAGIKDSGRQVRLGCLDEALINLILEVLFTCGYNVHLAIPAGRQDLATALGIYLQLDRRGQALREHRDPDDLNGPVVVLGLNLNITERLRRIRIGTNDLSQGLVVGRVRGDGDVIGLQGIPSAARAWRHGLLYLNTSLGYPILKQVRPDVAVVDGTTLRNPESLDRALQWCALHQARRTVLLGELGLPPLPCIEDDRTWLTFPLTPAIIADVRASLGSCDDAGQLSTNALVTPRRRPSSAAVYSAPAIALARRQALSAIAAARKVPGPQPEPIRDAVRLVNALGQLWGHPTTADRIAIEQGRTFSITALARRVENNRGLDLHGGWATFRETRFADLRRACVDLARLIYEENPRLKLLKELLSWTEMNRPRAPVCVRTVSRSAAQALAEDLRNLGVMMAGADAEDGSLITVRPYGDPIPWSAKISLELHLGAPPPWRRSSIFAATASEHVVVLEQDEVPWFKSSLAMLSASWEKDLGVLAAATDLEFPASAPLLSARKVFGPLTIDHRGEADVASKLVDLPDFDLTGLFASFTSTIMEAVEDSEEADFTRPSSLAYCLVLDPDARRYYVPSDSQIEVLVGDDYHVIPASDLTPGLTVLLSRGESQGDLFGRLKLVAHSDVDVQAANLLLERFRTATRDLHAKEGTWEKVVRAIQRYGSQVESGATCRDWAVGASIAPYDVEDIRRVFWALGDNRFTADGTWQRLGVLAKELRHLHQGLGRVISLAIGEAARGRPGPSCALVQESCGFDPMEVLEEFQVAKVRAIHAPKLVERSRLHHVLPGEGRLAAG